MDNVTVGIIETADHRRPVPFHVLENDAFTLCGRSTENLTTHRVKSTRDLLICMKCQQAYSAIRSDRELYL